MPTYTRPTVTLHLMSRFMKQNVHRKKKVALNRLILKTISFLLTLAICRRANRKHEVTAFTSFTFELLKDTSHITDVFKTQNNTSSQQLFVIHVSKESTPVVPFGGVGQIVGEIARGQTDNFTTVVILPRYGFIANTQTLLRLEFRIQGKNVKGTVHYLKRGNAVFLFIGPPSHISKLWQSTHIEDAYAQPRVLLRKIKAYATDLYFFFFCRGTARFIHVSSTSKCLTRKLFRCTRAWWSNVRLWFPRRPSPDISTIYTVHDYNREPFIRTQLKLFMYADKASIDRRKVHICDADDPRLSRL